MSHETLWWIALGSGLLVTGVVAGLLWAIHRAAGDIRDALAEIWVAGPRVANNTVHLDLLRRANLRLAALPPVAGRTADAVGRLHRHAQDCPECPTCVRRGQGEDRA